MKKKTQKLLGLVMAAAVVGSLLAGCAQKLSGTVATDGSTSMENVIGALGEAFMEQNDGVTFTYNPTGSGSGIQAVQEGRCDIGLSSRDLKDEEAASGLTATVLAYDGIAVIVHPDNPVADLDVETIAKQTLHRRDCQLEGRGRQRRACGSHWPGGRQRHQGRL